MDNNTLGNLIISALDEYCDAEELYGDSAWIEIDPQTPCVNIISDEEADSSPFDCYEVMSLLKPSPDDPASWTPDMEAIREIPGFQICNSPLLVVMLTHHDYTVQNAEEIFEQCKDTKALCWGMKELPLPPERMKALFARMKECGKTTALEVVGYSEEEGMRGAALAADCGCDILMGTKYFPSIAKFCANNGLRYMPFVGTIEGRPSVLTGSPEEIIAEAREAITGGAHGVDLLGYRYQGDAQALNKSLVESLEAPVCIAGSIDSFDRLDEVIEAAPYSFTIGSAFFENCFGGSFAEQIDKVCTYLEKKASPLAT